MLTSLPGPREVEAVADGLIQAMRRGVPWFDLSTNSPTVVRRLHERLAAKGIPLLGHQGEPYNCWLPVAEMSVNNDKEYFQAHPQYHMHRHPEMPSWQAQMAARV